MIMILNFDTPSRLSENLLAAIILSWRAKSSHLTKSTGTCLEIPRLRDDRMIVSKEFSDNLPHGITQPAFEEAKPAFEEAKPAFEEAKPAFEEAKPAFEKAKPAFERRNFVALRLSV